MTRQKVVFITGGAKRLGKALVEYYAQEGWKVFFTARFSFKEAVALSARWPGQVHCIKTAASSRQDAGMLVKWLEEQTNDLDLVVFNGSTFKKLTIEQTMPDMLEDLLGSNFIGPFFLLQQLGSLLRRSFGCVVTIADVQAQRGVADFSAYVAAKAAVVSLTKSAAVEFAPLVRVNAILPGSLPWPDGDNEYDEAAKSCIIAKIPMGRIGAWSDVVHAVQFLQTAPYITGVCLPVDGGRSAAF